MRASRLSRELMFAVATMTASAAMAAPPTDLMARPTQAQLQGAAQALATMPPALRADVAAAMPTLSPYMITLMCVQDDRSTRSLIEKYVGSRGTAMFNGWAGALSPGKRMRHHDMVGCLSVLRSQNWKRIAANEFSFDTVFVADDSGESYTWTTVVHKEPDGTWLIA